MVSRSPNNHYVIYRHEKIGLLHILSLLAFRRSFANYNFVECSGKKHVDLKNVQVDMHTARTLLVQKFFSVISKQLMIFGRVIELLLNLISINGGIISLMWKALTGSIKIPNSKAANYRSIIALIDDRLKFLQKRILDQQFLTNRAPRRPLI
uniref:Uncharacterized protein n=1 Tax=Ananas comosus var. bracteatus TaxID=296719 RepID=A0A6V7P5I9_ANACO|nr:unnamed protein product [Ananas comosus var. bracteatus]